MASLGESVAEMISRLRATLVSLDNDSKAALASIPEDEAQIDLDEIKASPENVVILKLYQELIVLDTDLKELDELNDFVDLDRTTEELSKEDALALKEEKVIDRVKIIHEKSYLKGAGTYGKLKKTLEFCSSIDERTKVALHRLGELDIDDSITTSNGNLDAMTIDATKLSSPKGLLEELASEASTFVQQNSYSHTRNNLILDKYKKLAAKALYPLKLDQHTPYLDISIDLMGKDELAPLNQTINNAILSKGGSRDLTLNEACAIEVLSFVKYLDSNKPARMEENNLLLCWRKMYYPYQMKIEE
jgi:hypothetical protein